MNIKRALRIGSKIINATVGSILFIGSGGKIGEDNSRFFWDDTNKRLGICTNTPLSKIHTLNSSSTEIGQIIQGAASQSADLLQIKDSADSDLLSIGSDGSLDIDSTAGLTEGFKIWETSRTATDSGFGKIWMDSEREIYNNSILRISAGSTGAFSSWIAIGGDGASWTSACARIDLVANQIYTRGSFYPQGNVTMPRVGDASSTATQKDTYNIGFANSLWNGTERYYYYSSLRATASITDNDEMRLSFLTGTTSSYTGGTEQLSILNNGKIGMGTTTPNSKLEVVGAISTPISTKTVNYTILISDSTILGDATSGAITITLPTAVGITGRKYTIKKIDSTANFVTIDGNGTETIDGATTFDLTAQYEVIEVQSDGSNWWII